MRLIFAGFAITVVALAIAIAAASQRPAPGPPSAASIVLQDYRFSPNRLDVKVGHSLTVTLTNAGTERHDLSFPSFHMPGLQGVESILEPGETRTITLRFEQPGYHTFICSVPGHATAGMTGVVFVQQ